MNAGKHTRRQALALAASGAAFHVVGRGAGVSSASAAGRTAVPIGMNLAGIADWEPGFPFINLMWGARIWLTKNASGSGPWSTDQMASCPLDENGYPLEIPFRPMDAAEAQYVFTILPNTLKPGRYVILYDGDGEIRIDEKTKLISARPGRLEIRMAHVPDAIEVLAIRRSTRGNHIRNIRVVPADSEGADLERNPFRPEFLEFCRPWHCLRFMDWQQTNDSLSSQWSKRTKRSFYTQVGTTGDPSEIPVWQQAWASGVAIELCIQLANQTHADAWVCVPHLFDDDAIRAMAVLAKTQLDPALRVYVEFSNEIWNWQFRQAQWMLQSELAGDLVTRLGGKPPWKGGKRPARFRDGVVEPGAGEGIDHPERIAALFRRCFAIWEEVFSGDDRKRLVRVCGVQAGWFDTIQRTLDVVMRHGGCDALAPAAYFGPDNEIYARWRAKGADLRAADVVADMRAVIATTPTLVRQISALAQANRVRLVAYEGGQHVQPENQEELPYSVALALFQKDPAIYDLTRANIDLWRQAGCDLFCAYSSVGRQGTRWGSWGHAEYYGQDPATMPKYRAILDANTPRS